MPFTFRIRKKILPGVILNIGRKSASVSVRQGPATRNWSTTGRRRMSVNLPGPFGWTTTSTPRSRQGRRPRG